MLTGAELARRLSTLPVFAGMADEHTLELARGADSVDLQPGELLFSEGEPPGDIFVVLAGELRVTCRTAAGSDVVVGMALPGAVLGEMSLFEQAPRSASVVAADRSLALRLPAARFVELVNAAHPAAWTLLRAVREQLVERLRSVDERVDLVLEPPTEERDSAALRGSLGELWSDLRGGKHDLG